MTEAVLSIDVGTTGCKVIAFDFKGAEAAKAYNEYPTYIDEYGKSELDAELVWEKVSESVRKVCSADIRVSAVSVSSLGEAAVLLDSEGNVLGNSILYNDSRGAKEMGEIADPKMREAISETTGQPVSHLHTLWKLLWIRKHQPEVYAKIKKITFFADFIVFRLCKAHMTDYSLAARSMMFDIHGLCWSREITALTGLSPDVLPKAVPAGTLAGEVSEETARELHIDKGAKVVIGGHDQPCGTLGAACFAPGQIVNAGGTIECITAVVEELDIAERLMKKGYSIEPHVVQGKYMIMGVSVTGGALLKWFRRTFLPDGKEFFEPYASPYEYMNAHIERKPGKLLLLPYFCGTGTPDYDSEACGAIYGLRLSTTKEEIYKACMEGLCFELKKNLEIMRQCGMEFHTACTIGGGSYSRCWSQIKADIWGVPVYTIEENEAVAAGLAALGAAALGWYGSPEQAAGQFVRFKDCYRADEVYRKEQEKKFRCFLELSDHMKQIGR